MVNLTSAGFHAVKPNNGAVGIGCLRRSMAMRLLGRRLLQQLKEQRVIFSSSQSTSSFSSQASSENGLMTCGRGDKKTKRGKRFKGSFGNARPKKEKKIQRIKDRIEVPRSTPWPLPFKLI
ncbi:hypothetical protein KFK09_024046 [Dendrobium nobile]|uniref:30S ribosomal protein S31, mitochondrial n=1 Tax=Dendrobium nobile TaxID=94219 RepID=A0A8T3ACR8_DENNO|nr:hypothetical protein KFK09_024046 [Dendrobium nobile]